MHEHIQESSLLRRRTKGNFACCFHSFLQVFERGFLQKTPISTGRNDRLKRGKLLTVFNIIALIFRDQEFFKRRAFLLTQPVDILKIRKTRQASKRTEVSIKESVTYQRKY